MAVYNAPRGGNKKTNSVLAPTDSYPERQGTVYEAKIGPNAAGGKGPYRFSEGLATDTDLPSNFELGVSHGYITAPGRPSRNANVYEKWPAETMAERAHVGSAAWVEAPTYLGEFSHGTDTVLAERRYEMINRGAPNPSGRRYERHNPAEVQD